MLFPKEPNTYVHNRLVKLCARSGRNFSQCSIERKACPIGAMRCHGIDDIRDRDDASLKDDRIPLDAQRITRAVNPLVMLKANSRDRPRNIQVAQYLPSKRGMGFHDSELVRGQLSGFGQYLEGESYLADVVNVSTNAQALASLFVESHIPADRSRQMSNTVLMPTEVWVTQIAHPG